MSGPRGARRGWILVALMMTMTLAAMDTTIVSTAIPQVVADLGGYTQFSWVFSAYLLTQTVTIPIYGKLADLYGRKPVLLIGALIFLAGSALCAAAWDMPSLIVFRALQGLGAGAVQAIVSTLAGDLYDLSERGRVQGWLSSVWGVSAIVGPTLGGAFAEYSTWRWIFLINLPIGALALTLIARFLHEDVRRTPHRIDYPGALLLLGAAATLIFGLLQGGAAWPWLSAPSAAVFGAAIAFSAAAVVVERRAAEPVMPPWVWGRRLLASVNLATIGFGMLVIGPSTFLPSYAQGVLGLGPIAAGLVLATMSIGWPLASSQSARLYMRIGFRDAALIGAAIALVGCCWFALMPQSPPVWEIVVAVFVLGVGFGWLSTPVVVGVQSTVTWNQRGVVTSANMFSRFLGQSIGAAVFGAVSNSALRERIAHAPAHLHGLPASADGISRALEHDPAGAAADYLRAALYTATHHVYVGLAATAVLVLVVLAVLAPRRFPIVSGARDADPAGKR
ncbi:MAG TPA: MDR family MFS transporter [Streptosporangiaceae bacterium]